MLNGDGLRVVLWLSGCSHHCKGCQNPQTWDVDSGILFDKESEEELFRELSKDYISGLTLTGGDPLHENNLDGVLNILHRIRHSYPGKTIWLYTGYTLETIEDIFEKSKLWLQAKWKNPAIKRHQIVSMCDVLVDGEYIDSQRDITLKWRGSSNQRVLDVQKTLDRGEIVLWC